MNFSGSDLNAAIQIITSIAKDEVCKSMIEDMKRVQRDLLEAEAVARRKKSTILIKSIARIDYSLELLQRDYSKIKSNMTPDAKSVVEQYISNINNQKLRLTLEKRKLSRESKL